MPEPEKKEDFTEDTSSVENTEIEDQAREMGWKPEAEWKGDPPRHGFVTAEEFVDTGKRVLPVVSAENRKLKEQIEEQGAEIASLRTTSAGIKAYADRAVARERTEKEAALEVAEGLRAQAISDSDGDAAVAAERDIRAIEKELDDIPVESTEARDPQIDAWIAENPWYSSDPEAQAVSHGLSIQIKNERPDLVGRPHLDELRRRVEKAIPHKFTNPNRSEAGPEGARRTPRTNGAKTFANLPADAKREFAEFKELIPEFTEKEYVENYEWDE